jgi:hypothetical protein
LELETIVEKLCANVKKKLYTFHITLELLSVDGIIMRIINFGIHGGVDEYTIKKCNKRFVNMNN